MNINGALYLLIINITIQNSFAVVNVRILLLLLLIEFCQLFLPGVLLGATDIFARTQQWHVSSGCVFHGPKFGRGLSSPLTYLLVNPFLIVDTNLCGNSFHSGACLLLHGWTISLIRLFPILHDGFIFDLLLWCRFWFATTTHYFHNP